MTALETFTTASKQPLTTGRRPDTTGICAHAVVHCFVFARQQPPSGYRRKPVIGFDPKPLFAPRQVRSECSFKAPRRAFHKSASVGREYFGAKI